jgi:membrane associated rhomboid family serine protease
VLGLVALMWLAELVDAVLPYDADQLGIQSRTVEGLLGIPLAPFLHVGFGHLVANTVPFVVLALLVSWRAGSAFWPVVATIVVVSGLGVWLLGPSDAVTLGASALVFGLLTYLVAAGFLTRHWLDVVIGVGVLLVYGSLLWGALPFFVPAGVSWLGHLCGAASGVLAAALFTDRRTPA